MDPSIGDVAVVIRRLDILRQDNPRSALVIVLILVVECALVNMLDSGDKAAVALLLSKLLC